MGAAMLAAYGCGWFETLQECTEEFLQEEKVYEPIEENVAIYQELFELYQQVYTSTAFLNKELMQYRQ